jgi:hypothetical protein
MPGTTEKGSASEFVRPPAVQRRIGLVQREGRRPRQAVIREIDKGLKNSRVGIVLVTPALLKSIEAEGRAEKELPVLLASGRVIPVAHGTTFEALRNVSPMLALHAGLDTAESSLEDVAAKVAAAAAALAVDDG